MESGLERGKMASRVEGLRLLGISRSRAMVPVLTPGQEPGHPWDCGRNAGFYPTRPPESDPCGRGQQSGFLQALRFPRTYWDVRTRALGYEGWWRTKVTGQEEFKKLRSWDVAGESAKN